MNWPIWIKTMVLPAPKELETKPKCGNYTLKANHPRVLLVFYRFRASPSHVDWNKQCYTDASYLLFNINNVFIDIQLELEIILCSFDTNIKILL